MNYQLPVPPEPEQPRSCLHFPGAEPERDWSGTRLDVTERDTQLIAGVADHLVRAHLSPMGGLLRVDAVDARMDRGTR